MGFYYSPNTGMMESSSSKFKTPELAIIGFYKKELNDLYKNKETAEEELRKINERIARLTESFKSYVDEYPEEFI